MGNFGATSEHDGQEGVAHIGANQSNVPVEMIEAEYPIRVEHYGIAPDTGGPGRHRGGLSLVRSYRVLVDGAELNVRSDKRKHPPHGLLGGSTGAPSRNLLRVPGASDRELPVLLTRPEPFPKDAVFHHTMAGAGGYGDPFTRDPAHVLWDVVEEKVTIAHAAAAYGVVIEPGDSPVVDEMATAALRDARKPGPVEQ